MAKTTNLKLNKPLISDVFELEKFNENADILDSEVQSVKDRTSQIESTLALEEDKNTTQDALLEKTVKGKGQLLDAKLLSSKGNDTNSLVYTFAFSEQFSEPPVVIATAWANANDVISTTVYDVTSTTCKVKLYRRDLTFGSSFSYGAYVMAIGV